MCVGKQKDDGGRWKQEKGEIALRAIASEREQGERARHENKMEDEKRRWGDGRGQPLFLNRCAMMMRGEDHERETLLGELLKQGVTNETECAMVEPKSIYMRITVESIGHISTRDRLCPI